MNEQLFAYFHLFAIYANFHTNTMQSGIVSFFIKTFYETLKTEVFIF